LLKKVVVVVSQNPTVCQSGDIKVVEFRQEEFKGKDLIVINKLPEYSAYGSGYYGSELLIVKDGKEELAVFKDWLYWKKIA